MHSIASGLGLRLYGIRDMLPVKKPRKKPAITKIIEVYRPTKVKPKDSVVYLSERTYITIP
jgi:hypothetical protein